MSRLLDRFLRYGQIDKDISVAEKGNVSADEFTLPIVTPRAPHSISVFEESIVRGFFLCRAGETVLPPIPWNKLWVIFFECLLPCCALTFRSLRQFYQALRSIRTVEYFQIARPMDIGSSRRRSSGLLLCGNFLSGERFVRRWRRTVLAHSSPVRHGNRDRRGR